MYADKRNTYEESDESRSDERQHPYSIPSSEGRQDVTKTTVWNLKESVMRLQRQITNAQILLSNSHSSQNEGVWSNSQNKKHCFVGDLWNEGELLLASRDDQHNLTRAAQSVDGGGAVDNPYKRRKTRSSKSSASQDALFSNQVSPELVDMISEEAATHPYVTASIASIERYMLAPGLWVRHSCRPLKPQIKILMQKMWVDVVCDVIRSMVWTGIAVGRLRPDPVIIKRIIILHPSSYLIQYSIDAGTYTYRIRDRASGKLIQDAIVFSKDPPLVGGRLQSIMATLLIPILEVKYMRQLQLYVLTRNGFPTTFIQETSYRNSLHSSSSSGERQTADKGGAGVFGGLYGNPMMRHHTPHPLHESAMESGHAKSDGQTVASIDTPVGRLMMSQLRSHNRLNGKNTKPYEHTIDHNNEMETMTVVQPYEIAATPVAKFDGDMNAAEEQLFHHINAAFMTPESIVRSGGSGRYKSNQDLENERMQKTVTMWASYIEHRCNEILSSLYGDVSEVEVLCDTVIHTPNDSPLNTTSALKIDQELASRVQHATVDLTDDALGLTQAFQRSLLQLVKSRHQSAKAPPLNVSDESLEASIEQTPVSIRRAFYRVLKHERTLRQARVYAQSQLGNHMLGIPTSSTPDTNVLPDHDIDPRFFTSSMDSSHHNGLYISLMWMVDNRHVHTIRFTNSLTARGKAEIEYLQTQKRLHAERISSTVSMPEEYVADSLQHVDAQNDE